MDLVTPLDREYAKRAMRRRVTGPLRGEEVPVVSIEDLIILKVLSTRPQDMEDAARIFGANEETVERDLIEDEIARLSIKIHDHEIGERWARIRATLPSEKKMPGI